MTDQDEQMTYEYADLETWLDEWLAPTYEQGINSEQAWCSEWYLHFGAVQRLYALWQSWEVARAEGGGAMATWFVSIADPMMRELMKDDGTFYGCKATARGHFATRWIMKEAQLAEVQQQAPQLVVDANGGETLVIPNVQGVLYSTAVNRKGQLVVSAAAEEGYRLNTGHRLNRPHPLDALPLVVGESGFHFPAPEDPAPADYEGGSGSASDASTQNSK